MRPKLIVILLVLVSLPLVILGWLGAKAAHDSREIVQHRFQELLLDNLRTVEKEIAEILKERREQLLDMTDSISYEKNTFRQLVRDNAIVKQTFLLDSDGRLVYPTDEAANRTELEFLVRTGSIWKNRDLFSRPAEQALAQSTVSRQATPSQASPPMKQKGNFESPSSPPVGEDYGWYTWYWDQGLHLLFWRRNESGDIIGAELDRIRLLSDIVARLPETDPLDPQLPSGRIALVDSSGDVAYPWGAYEPEENEKPRASLSLSYPLNSWRLDYYMSSERFDAALGTGARFNLIASLITIGLVLVGLAIYFYRESCRDMREAAQRVTFVNQVSHELKTPLTNIRMYAELLDHALHEREDKTGRYLDVIVSESQRLSRLIGNILTFSRKQRDKLSLHPTSGVVDEVIRSVLENFTPSLESQGVHVRFSANAGKKVKVDADALEQILGNLFSNVEKYASQGGSLEVTSRQEGDRTVITVSDQGPGIPEREREKIFSPFYRLSDRLADGVTGTGIGLAIARDLAELHSGSLTLLPCSKGASFEIVLQTPEDSGRHPS